MFARKNARNMVVVAGPLVFKLPRDGNVARVLREFALSWKAFLRGLSPPVLLVGPVLLRARVDLLKDVSPTQEDLDEIERLILRLSEAGIEHRELRHPERHVGLWRGSWVFIDFDHARLTTKSRDLNKFRAWRRGWERRRGQILRSGT